MDNVSQAWAWSLNTLGIRPNKREWPECVGMKSSEAFNIIHRDWSRARVVFIQYKEPEPGFILFSTQEKQINRVRIVLVGDIVKDIPHLEWWT